MAEARPPTEELVETKRHIDHHGTARPRTTRFPGRESANHLVEGDGAAWFRGRLRRRWRPGERAALDAAPSNQAIEKSWAVDMDISPRSFMASN
jgi:hypothetical protein